MPRVPTYDGFQASPNLLPSTNLQGARGPNVQDTAGVQAQQAGRAMEQAGGQVGRIALDMARQANQLRVGEGMTQLVKADTDLQTEALQLKGRNALDRPDGKSLADEYSDKLQATVDSIYGGLGNDAQKQAFQYQAGQLKQQMYARLSTHMVRQQDVYADESSKAQVDTALYRIGSLPADEEAFGQSLGAIQNAVIDQAQRNGADTQIATAKFHAIADQAYYTRYKAWQQEDPVAALASFQANRAKIGALMRDRIGDETFRAAQPQLASMAKPWLLSAGTAPAGLESEPRGVRNNNPGNIRQSSTAWQGEVQGNDPSYATFATPEAGIRAMGKNLLAYQDNHGLNTVGGIISRWAPATENDTAAYTVTVAKALGVKPDDKLDLHDPAVMSKMVGAMIQVENGKQPYTDAQIATGVNAALGKGALPAAVATSGVQDYGYGNRQDGTPKGKGFLGELKRPDGGVMTEYTVGVEINGKEMDIPTLVPTLTKDEVDTLLNIKVGEQPPDAIVQKAVDYAKQRLSDGKGVFADNNPGQAQAASLPEPAWRDPNATTGNPIIDNLPPDQRAQVYSMAHAQIRQDMTQARDLLTSRVNDASAEYTATGKATNPPSESEFIQAYGQSEGMQRYQAFQDVATLGQKLQQTKTLSNNDLLSLVVNSKPTPGDGFAVRERNYEILQKAVKQTLEERKSDPVKFALQNPALGIQPIADFGNVNALMTEVGKRKGVMDKIAGDYGTRPTILTNDEATQFGKFLGTLQPPDKARVLGNFAAIGGEAGARSLSAQLKDKDNTLAVAATLSAYTTDPTTHWFGPDTPGTNVGQMYLEGKDAIEQKRAKIDATAEFGVKAEIYKAIDGVYQTPQGRDAAAEAAYGIYAKLQAGGSGDVERAVRLATGGVMEFNGGKIAKPYGWDDSKFRDAITETLPQAIKDAGGRFILGGQKLDAADLAKVLPGARLQTYSQGSYLVMSGNDVVRNQDGTPYILKVAP